MNRKFDAVPNVCLRSHSTFEHPPTPPELIHLDSAALTVMTDFRFVHPVTVAPDVPIDAALQKMKTAGVRLLLVTNGANEVIGLITAAEIMGEKPIKIIEETRVQRSNIKVSAIMTPQRDIRALDITSVRVAQVGEIIETLRLLERQHVLVVGVDRTTGAQRVVGMFSTSQISKLLGRDVNEDVPPAHSLAEIVQRVG